MMSQELADAIARQNGEEFFHPVVALQALSQGFARFWNYAEAV